MRLRRPLVKFLRVLALCLCVLLTVAGIRDVAQYWGTTVALVGATNAGIGVLGLVLLNLHPLLRRR